MLRTLYIWGDPLAWTRKIEGDRAQLPPADRAADLGPGGGGRRRREDKVNRFNADLFHLIVVWLLLSCRRKINLFIGQQCRGLLIKENIMKASYTNVSQLQITIEVGLADCETIITKLEDKAEGNNNDWRSKDLAKRIKTAKADSVRQIRDTLKSYA